MDHLRDGPAESLPLDSLNPSRIAARLFLGRGEPQNWNARTDTEPVAKLGLASGGEIEELLGLRLHVEPDILMLFVSGHSRDALDEVEDACRRTAFLSEHGLDDLRRLALREAALAQELGPVLVGAGDDLRARRLDAVDEGTGQELANRVSAGIASARSARPRISSAGW